jgi:hypothetical protein
MAEAGSFAEKVKQQADIVRVVGELCIAKTSFGVQSTNQRNATLG